MMLAGFWQVRRVGSMVRALLLVGALACALTSVAEAQELTHGKLRVNRPGRGKIDLTTGSATFRLNALDLLPSDQSDGINPGTETITIGISEERFLIPAGHLKVSRNGKRFRYKEPKADRGIQLFEMKKRPDQTFRVNLKLVGVDLSSLVTTNPPLCLPFAIIVGNDDGFTGISFDLPNPYPSRRLSIPGFCTDEASWPWTS